MRKRSPNPAEDNEDEQGGPRGREQLRGRGGRGGDRTSQPVCGPRGTGWRKETWQERPQGDIQPCAQHVQSPKQHLRTVRSRKSPTASGHCATCCRPRRVHCTDVLSVHWAPCDNPLRWLQPLPGALVTLLSAGFHKGVPLAGAGSRSHTQAHTHILAHVPAHSHTHRDPHTHTLTLTPTPEAGAERGPCAGRGQQESAGGQGKATVPP